MDPMSRVLINFDRRALGQPGGGHFSPIGSYAEREDAFLVMDASGGGMAIVPAPFDIFRIDRGAGGAVIEWTSVPDTRYVIEFSVDLDAWLEVDDEVLSKGGTTTYLDESKERAALTRGFYRVRRAP